MSICRNSLHTPSFRCLPPRVRRFSRVARLFWNSTCMYGRIGRCGEPSDHPMSSAETSRAEVHRGMNELPPDAIVFGRSAQMEALRHRLEKIAGLDMPVLIEGESGTGKDIVARI